jgi:ABC-2 type transport system ATP-binding protein
VLLQDFHARGKTILVTSHILSDLEEICTSVGILEKGQLLRVGKLSEVLQRRTAARKFRLKLSAPVHELQIALSTRSGVRASSGSNLAAEFDFEGDDSAVAALLRSLIEGGAAVCEFTEIQETLESVYSRLSSGEVM